MQFMMILKSTADSEAGKPLDPRLMTAVAAAAEQAKKEGRMVMTGALLPSSAGARVNVAAGKISVTDGPFAETKELVGGFAILEAGSLKEAIEGAKAYMQIHADILGPNYQGQMEVRQLMSPAYVSECHKKTEEAATSK